MSNLKPISLPGDVLSGLVKNMYDIYASNKDNPARFCAEVEKRYVSNPTVAYGVAIGISIRYILGELYHID